MEDGKKVPLYQKIQRGIQKSYWNIVILIALCTIVIVGIWNWDSTLVCLRKVVSVLSPFLIAVFVAYLLSALMKPIDKLLNRAFFHGKGKKARWIISIVLSYIIVIGIIVISMIYIIPQIGESVKQLDVEKAYQAATNRLDEWQHSIPLLKNSAVNGWMEDMKPTIINYGTNFAKFVFPLLYNFSISMFMVAFNIILAIVISCYIIVDKENLKKNLKRFIFAFAKKKSAPAIWDTLLECNHIFNGFLIGKTLDSLIIGVMCFIIMKIIGFPYAILLSVIVGVTNMIPYFGPFIGAIPGVVIYLLINPRDALIFAIMIFALQQFDGFYLGPKILGDQTGLKPLWVIFGITVGGAYFGVLGMFLGVPIVAVVAYLVEKSIDKRLKKKNINDI